MNSLKKHLSFTQPCSTKKTDFHTTSLSHFYSIHGRPGSVLAQSSLRWDMLPAQSSLHEDMFPAQVTVCEDLYFVQGDGNRQSTRRNILFDDNENDYFDNILRKSKTVDDFFMELTMEKRVSVREAAVSSILKALTDNIEQEFVEKNFVTLMYEFMHCLKKGSPKVMEQATKTIGLLAMITGYADIAHEAYEDVKAAVSHQLGLKSKLKNLKILDCLAVVTFFGASNSDETEQAMQLLWKFIHPESDSEMESKGSPAVLTAAISAWSFLLTTLDGWRVSHKNWRGAISYFSNLLDNDNETVCAAASEALALIFETNCLEKFSIEFTNTHGSIPEGVTSIKVHSKKELKDNIIKQLRSWSARTSTVKHMSTQDTRTASDAVLAALNFLEEGNCPNASETIGGKKLTVSTWSQMIQLKFMKHFLGKDGFANHMMRNENLHNVFEFEPKRSNSSGSHSTLYEPEREEVAVRFFLPPVQRPRCSPPPLIGRRERKLAKRMTKSPSSNLNKARTMLLKKQRELSSQGRNNGCFADDD